MAAGGGQWDNARQRPWQLRTPPLTASYDRDLVKFYRHSVGLSKKHDCDKRDLTFIGGVNSTRILFMSVSKYNKKIYVNCLS